MSTLFYLSRAQPDRSKPYFPLSHGIPRVDDLRILSGIIRVCISVPPRHIFPWWVLSVLQYSSQISGSLCGSSREGYKLRLNATW